MCSATVTEKNDSLVAGTTEPANAVVLTRRGATIAVDAVWPSNAVPSTLLTAMGNLCFSHGKPTTRSVQPAQGMGEQASVTALPLVFDQAGAAKTVIVAIIPCASSHANRQSAANQASADHSAQDEIQPNDAPTSSRHDDIPRSDWLSNVLRLISEINSHSKTTGAALAFVNELVRQTHAQRVAVGFIEDGVVKLAAISDSANFDRRSPFVRDLGLAMNEAIDQAATIRFPDQQDTSAGFTLAHERFTARYDSKSLCTVPIVTNQDGTRTIVGAVTLESGKLFRERSATIDFLEHAVSLVGPILNMHRRSDHSIRGWVARVLGYQNGRELSENRRPSIAVLGAAGGVLILAMGLIPMPYHVSANARLEGAIQRVVTVPAQGFIGKVHVKPGQTVRSGQVLVELDDRELALEAGKWRSEEAKIQKQYGEALAAEAQTDIAIARANLSQAKIAMQHVQAQLSRLRLKAPFDGVVISGDLSQSLGAPVQRGDSLMVVAPLNNYRIVAQVDERDVTNIVSGQSGRLILPAIRGGDMRVVVEQVTPISVIRGETNVFEVHAQFVKGAHANQATEFKRIRPGLQGIVKFEVGERALLTSMTQRLRDWIRLTLWKWWG